ncbi:MAG TPA: hypothetical protein PKY70_08745 [Nakamurella multipartita]|nr:hypothetical protein [Nakamurella multipartita]
MRMLISVWLARWQAAIFNRFSALAARLFGLVFPDVMDAPRGVPGHPATHRTARHHSPDEHAVPGIWLIAPRVTTAVWVAGAVVILARYLHLAHHAGPPAQIYRLSHDGTR